MFENKSDRKRIGKRNTRPEDELQRDEFQRFAELIIGSEKFPEDK